MKRIPLVVASFALLGVCVLSRWCSEISNDIDKLTRGRP